MKRKIIVLLGILTVLCTLLSVNVSAQECLNNGDCGENNLCAMKSGALRGDCVPVDLIPNSDSNDCGQTSGEVCFVPADFFAPVEVEDPEDEEVIVIEEDEEVTADESSDSTPNPTNSKYPSPVKDEKGKVTYPDACRKALIGSLGTGCITKSGGDDVFIDENGNMHYRESGSDCTNCKVDWSSCESGDLGECKKNPVQSTFCGDGGKRHNVGQCAPYLLGDDEEGETTSEDESSSQDSNSGSSSDDSPDSKRKRSKFWGSNYGGGGWFFRSNPKWMNTQSAANSKRCEAMYGDNGCEFKNGQYVPADTECGGMTHTQCVDQCANAGGDRFLCTCSRQGENNVCTRQPGKKNE